MKVPKKLKKLRKKKKSRAPTSRIVMTKVGNQLMFRAEDDEEWTMVCKYDEDADSVLSVSSDFAICGDSICVNDLFMDDQVEDKEFSFTLRILSAMLEDLHACNEAISMHRDIEPSESVEQVAAKIKAFKTDAELFAFGAGAIVNEMHDFLELAQEREERLQKKFQEEHEHRLRLEETLKQLTKKHSEQTAAVVSEQIDDSSDDSGEDEYFDAVEEIQTDELCLPSSGGSDLEYTQDQVVQASTSPTTIAVVPRQRRTLIPEKPSGKSQNLWSILKNSVGQDLTKMAIPVNFFEPLSMTQRAVEEFEYSSCLDMAAQCQDPCEQMAYIAAFTVSAYATTSNRTGKPFNPLLGETFECDRSSDLGWKSICEQVSQEPLTASMHTQGKKWNFWQDAILESSFCGMTMNSMQVVPKGMAHLEFKESGNHYTWRRVTTSVHNLGVGTLWIEHHGEMDIKNHTTGDNCHLTFTPYRKFSSAAFKQVSGVITDASGEVRYMLEGKWDEKIEGSPVVEIVQGWTSTEYKTGEKKLLWERKQINPDMETRYNFSQLAVELNEMEQGVAPTDSRNRPDIRQMEEGNYDQAKEIRASFGAREYSPGRSEKIKPLWFRKEIDELTGESIHVFTDEYWNCKENQDWKKCPDLYSM